MGDEAEDGVVATVDGREEAPVVAPTLGRAEEATAVGREGRVGPGGAGRAVVGVAPVGSIGGLGTKGPADPTRRKATGLSNEQR